MQKINLHLGIKEILMLILLTFIFGLIFSFDKVVALFDNQGTEIKASRQATKELSNLILDLDQVNFDTSVLSSAYFTRLSNLPTFPIDETNAAFGKVNPFTANFNFTSTPVATTTIGGIIYSNQREDGQGALTAVRVAPPRIAPRVNNNLNRNTTRTGTRTVNLR